MSVDVGPYTNIFMVIVGVCVVIFPILWTVYLARTSKYTKMFVNAGIVGKLDKIFELLDSDITTKE